MYAGLKFSLEMVNGDRLGKLAVPYSEIANWINFLASPHYGAQVIYAEQHPHGVDIYFEACEGLYEYLSDRINTQARTLYQETASLALAS